MGSSDRKPHPNSDTSTAHQQRLQNEVDFHSAVAMRELDSVARTSDHLVERYRHCRQWRTRYPECVIRFLTLNKPEHICDFGCGSGEMACRLGRLGYKVTGLDVSPELIEVARERARLDGVTDLVNFKIADAASMDADTQKFDAVLAMSVIHHMPLEEALDSLEALLHPGGSLALLEPVAYSPMLQWLRDRTPVDKDVSPDERQLGQADIDRIRERFRVQEERHFHILGRLSRVIPRPWSSWADVPVRWLDRTLLSIPGMNHFAGIVAILARRRA